MEGKELNHGVKTEGTHVVPAVGESVSVRDDEKGGWVDAVANVTLRIYIHRANGIKKGASDLCMVGWGA